MKYGVAFSSSQASFWLHCRGSSGCLFGLFRVSWSEDLIIPSCLWKTYRAGSFKWSGWIFAMPQPILGRRHPDGGWGSDKCLGRFAKVFFPSKVGFRSLGTAAPGGSFIETGNCSLGFRSCWTEGLEKIVNRNLLEGTVLKSLTGKGPCLRPHW